MIRNKSHFYLLFFLLLLSFQSVKAQNEGQLFESVFGKIVSETKLQLYVHGKLIEEVPVRIQGVKVLAYDSSKLDNSLRTIIKKNSYKKFSLKQRWIDVKDVPYNIIYDANELHLTLSIPPRDLKPIFYSFDNNLHIKYRNQKIEPAPFAGSINYYVDKNYGDDYLGGENFSVNIDSFFNLNSYVLQMNGFYIENEGTNPESYWQRKDFNLTKDLIDQRTRIRLGDTTSRAHGFMRSKYIGGLNIKKEFNIDPYTKSYSQGEKEFQIIRRSKVKTYVNGSLVKNEILPAGNYKLSRLPLVSGLNNIRVEIDDGIGEVEVLEFNIPISLNILRKGENDYSISYGRKINDSGKTRSYRDEEFTSAFLSYGFNDNYTLAGYHQRDDAFSLTGISNGLGTNWGNFFIGAAYATNSELSNNGFASAFSWELQDIIGDYLKGLSVALRYEHFVNRFQYSLDDTSDFLKNNSVINLSLPLFGKLYVNLGGGISNYRDSSKGKKTYLRSSISYNPLSNLNISVYASQTDSTTVGTSNSLSAFLTWSFVEKNRYISIQRDIENESGRISFTQDNSSKIYKPRYTVSLEDDKQSTRVSLSSTTPVPMADVFFKASVARDKSDKNYHQYGLGFSTTTLFAYNNEFAFSQARTNNQSFAIFKTDEELSMQPLSIRTTSIYADAKTPLLGNPAIVDLTPYQYQEVQIDPSLMDYGTTIEQEKFVLFPTYKSGHFISVKSNGARSIKGYIKRSGKPVSLEVCQLGERVFFTDRDGFFFVDGVKEDISLLKVSGKQVQHIDVGKEKTGLIDLGIINIK